MIGIDREGQETPSKGYQKPLPESQQVIQAFGDQARDERGPAGQDRGSQQEVTRELDLDEGYYKKVK